MNERNRDLLDLPLAGGKPPAAAPGTAFAAAARRRRRWPALLLVAALVALGIVAGYLIPRSGPPVASPSEALLDFGAQRLRSAGEPRQLTVGNGGERALEIAAVTLGGEAAAEFALAADGCSGARLDRGASCAVAVVFEPTAAGARRAELAVASNAANSPLGIALTGTGTAPAVGVEPAALDFGQQAVGGEGAPAVVTVRNTGSAPLAIKAVGVEGAGAADFRRLTDPCSDSTLDPGERCGVVFAFAPTAEGERRASLRIWSDAPEEAPRVGITGVGTAAAEPVGEGEVAAGAGDEPEAAYRLAVDPDRLDFGERRLGAAAEGTARLVNRGAAPVGVERAALAGADRDAFATGRDGCSGTEIAPGAGCTVDVSFRPRREGDHRAELAFGLRGARPDGSGLTVELSGRGIAPRLEISGLVDDAIAFGGVTVGAGVERRVELANAGTAPLRLRRLEVGGPDAGDFTLVGEGCPRELKAGGRCALTVRFAPSSAGAKGAELVVDSDAEAGGEPRRLPLRATALPRPTPEIRLSVTALRFGEQPVGQRSSILDLTVANPGSARLVVNEIAVGGPAAGDFRVVPGSCAVPGFLAPGGECTVGVRFIPTAAGERRARLTVRHNAPGATVAADLVGRGVGG